MLKFPLICTIKSIVGPVDYSPWSEITRLLTYAWSRVGKRFLQSTTRENRKGEPVGLRQDITVETEVGNSLRAILGKANRILTQYVQHSEYANYLDRLYDKLYSNKPTFDVKDRSMVMELCRLINMDLFIEANVREGNGGTEFNLGRANIKK